MFYHGFLVICIDSPPKRKIWRRYASNAGDVNGKRTSSFKHCSTATLVVKNSGAPQGTRWISKIWGKYYTFAALLQCACVSEDRGVSSHLDTSTYTKWCVCVCVARQCPSKTPNDGTYSQKFKETWTNRQEPLKLFLTETPEAAFDLFIHVNAKHQVGYSMLSVGLAVEEEQGG